MRELLCQICDREYVVWFAPSHLWNKYIRNSDGSDKYQFLCPTCFTVELESQGYETIWKVAPDIKKEMSLVTHTIKGKKVDY